MKNITNVLSDNIIHLHKPGDLNFKSLLHLIKEEANVLTGSMLNRYSLKFPSYPNHIDFSIKLTAPEIIFNILSNQQHLDKTTIDGIVKGGLKYLTDGEGNIININ